MGDKESTVGFEIISHKVFPDLAFGGEYNVWFIRLCGRTFYVSHQSCIPFVGSECIALDAAEIDGELVVQILSAELAVSKAADPLDALADVVEQLEAKYGN